MPTQEEYDRLKRKYEEANALCEHLERQALTDDAERVLRREADEKDARIADLERQIEQQFLHHAEITLGEVRQARAEERDRCMSIDNHMVKIETCPYKQEEAQIWGAGVLAGIAAYRESIRALGDE